ncbi:polymorphic toxin-type HINT domain-containing protein, partial [Kitasatospora sp. NPDC058965]|uniref:polymorphic toxin-type HINT domain-containing protein n=1 Tax=Kitasatospora sp. NPDC058965 TaxID=3346682 RepID=UPI00368C4A0A
WNGEYFKVTTTDGTQYYLGLNHSPGSTSDPATNSAWGEPVYTPKSGDPCYDSAKGNNSFCANMGYRFNLDFVVDPQGNLQRYDWATESNFYNMGYGQVAQSGAGGTMTQYTRGGYLTQISYGYKLADEQAGHDPAAKVAFAVTQRCTKDAATCATLNTTTAPNWPDTPYDLNCTSGMATSGTGSNVCQVDTPTFWTSYRLQTITTSVKTGSGWQNVDSYTLTHLFSDAGGTMDPVTGKTVDPKDAGALQSVMWLSQIQRTGQDTTAGAGGSLTLDPVTFTGVEMDNRVDGLTPAAPPLYHPRISSLQTETGESIAVTYRAPECSRVNNTMPASPDSDTMACYNVYWYTPGAVTPTNDWFQKTLVAQISDNDATKANSPAKVTSYTYSGGAAWHRDDSDLTDDQYRTWNDFRGYRTITTTTGSAPDPITQSTASYFQGMDGDYKADGTQRSVSLANSLGEATTDSNWLAGAVQEVDQYNQAGGSVIAKSLVSAPVFTTTVTSPRTATTSKTPAPALSTLPDLAAHRIRSTSTRSQQLLADGRTWRTTQSSSTYDAQARLSQVDALGDVTVPSQEACTTTSYANPPASNPMMLSYPDETLVVTGPCSTAAGSSTTVSDRRFFYDGDGTVTNPGSFGQLGTNGYLTATQAAQSYDAAGHPVFQTQSARVLDQYGRVTRSTDAAGQVTTIGYTPTSGTLPTGVSTTNPLGWTASNTLAPGRGLIVHSSDVNQRVSDSTFDALGRRTASWLPGRDKATQSADKLFSYAVNGAGNPNPSSVTTQTLREDNSYSTAVDLYDGFLQQRQRQTTTADNSAGRLISSAHYDSHGWLHSTVPAFSDTTTAPGSTLFVETENTLPSETVSTYDGSGRGTGQTLYAKAAPLWTSTVSYPGADETDSTPPQGGTPTSVFTDALGRTTRQVSHGGAGVGDVTTSYGYTPGGRPATVQDNAGNTWSYTYDLVGRLLSETDPDSGKASTSYDSLGRVASATDARGQTLSYTYDALSRRTGEYSGTSTTDSSKQLAGWSFDTLLKGYPTASTRYANGGAYTTAVTGYNNANQPTGTTVTIPTGEGKLAGSYTVGSSYTPNVGMLSGTTYNGDGGLLPETVGYGYNLGGGMVSMGSDFAPYLDLASYSPVGQVLQSTYGVLGKQLRTAQTYDDATSRLATNRVSLQTATTNPISAFSYAYDQAGDLTGTSELQSSGGADQVVDTQCFQYDGLKRLTQAWTDTAGLSSPTAGQLAHCTSTNPAPATLGGPAPYWTSWQYNLLGDRTQQVQHDLTGNTAKNTVQTLSYPTNGVQPNTVSSISTTGPAGTTTLTPHYDATGNTKDRATTGVGAGSQTFTYDEEGRTKAVTTAVGVNSPQTTGYLYDADGGLLIQRTPNSAILYLFGGAEQLTLAGGAVTGQRYYHGPDGTVLVRSSNGTVSYQPATPQGTAQLQVDAKTLTITRRQFDPYGNARGTVPGSWADNHGYLGQPSDATTGLSLLGARQYDPAIGRFLSADPLLEAGDPNQMGGYAYSGDNPVSSSDPSGLRQDCGNCQNLAPGPPSGGPIGFWDALGTLAGGVLAGLDFGGCELSTEGAGDCVDQGESIFLNVCGFIAGDCGPGSPHVPSSHGHDEPHPEPGKAPEAPHQDPPKPQPFDPHAFDGLDNRDDPRMDRHNTGNADPQQDPTTTPPATTPTSDPTSDSPSTPSTGTHTGTEGGSSHDTNDHDGKHPTCSFAPDTLVLLADGTTKPIDQVQPGDQVATADPTTGQQQDGQPVTAALVHHDTDLVDLTVTGPDGARSTVSTTANHPFWDATRHGWVPAGELPAGDRLQAEDGTVVQVVVVTVTPGEADRYNLTVQHLHTYYVVVGRTPVLVHNECDDGVEGKATSTYHPGDEQYNPHSDEMQKRRADNQAFYDDQAAYASVPQEVHDLVADVVPNLSYPQRRTPKEVNGVVQRVRDFFQGRNVSGADRRYWANSVIYDNGTGDQVRIMINPRTGQVSWFGLKNGVHDYSDRRDYPWARRTPNWDRTHPAP